MMGDAAIFSSAAVAVLAEIPQDIIENESLSLAVPDNLGEPYFKEKYN